MIEPYTKPLKNDFLLVKERDIFLHPHTSSESEPGESSEETSSNSPDDNFEESFEWIEITDLPSVYLIEGKIGAEYVTEGVFDIENLIDGDIGAEGNNADDESNAEEEEKDSKESKPESKESKPESKESKPESKELKPESKESKPEENPETSDGSATGTLQRMFQRMKSWMLSS